MPSAPWDQRGQHADEIIARVLDACDPRQLIDQAWTLSPAGPVTLLAAGKASAAMAMGAIHRLGSIAAGLVLGPQPVPGVRSLGVDHPLATDRNLRAAEEAEQLVTGFGPEDTLVLLLSGGASAHLTLPAQGVDLADLRDVTDRLMRAGATIDELNTVRKHIERLKGGRLGALAHPARVHTLILSDVVDDRLDVIGSGPGVPDPTTYADALDVMQRRRVSCPPIEAHLRRGADGDIDETPKPGCAELAGVQTTIVGNRHTALHAARDWAQSHAFEIRRADANVTGEASHVGAALVRDALASGSTGAWIIAGETTVSGVQPGAVGGPAQELALAAAIELAGARAMLVSFTTDGIDGPTDAAGARVDSTTADRIRAQGMDPIGALASHTSHEALKVADALITTGPTGTNVNDLAILLLYEP